MLTSAPLSPILTRVFCAGHPVRFASVYCVLEDAERGGTRVVVTDDHDPLPHVGPGEQAICVPGYYEPLYVDPPGYREVVSPARTAFDRWPVIVARAEAEGKQHTNRHRFST